MTPTWRVAPLRPPRFGLLARLLSWLFRRPERPPTVYQRCLAVHIHFAGPKGGMS